MTAPAEGIDAALDRIREKLAQSAMTLEAPAQEDDVADFEKEHGIVLPPDYRAFILRIGDGGDGPDTRLHPLWDGSSNAMELMAVPGDLRLEEARIPTRFVRPRDGAAAMRSDDRRELRGLVVLSDDGAGIAKMLCVHGREYGRIIRVEGEDGYISLSYFDDFLGWYEAWLDDALRGWSPHYHGSYMPGDEAGLMEVATSGAPGHIRRAAVHSLDQRAPVLSEATMAVLGELARGDPDRDVRERAAHALHNRTT